MFPPKTISELLEHPDYPRLIKAGPRFRAPLRLGRLMPLFIFLTFCGIVVYELGTQETPQDVFKEYGPLALFAFVIVAMLAKVGLTASLKYQPVEITSLGPVQAEPERGCPIELKTQQGTTLSFFAPERLSSALVQGDVGVAYVAGDRLVDLRRLQDLPLSSPASV